MKHDDCRACEELLVASMARKLAPGEMEMMIRHLADCPACREFDSVLRKDDRRLTAFVEKTDDVIARMEDRIMERVHVTEQSAPPVWRRVIASKRLPLAIAAVLAVCIVFGMNLLDRDGGAGLVWADVLARVEEAEDFICRRIEQRTGEEAQEIVEYRSARYGLRQDIYQHGSLLATQYINPRQRMLYALVHRDRTWMRQRMTEEQIESLREQSNAAAIVGSFRDYDYTSLGRKRIEGHLAEGIEISDPAEWSALFESGSWRLWVDVETEWPVRIELEGSARGGKVHKTYTLTEFQWNPTLAKTDFEVEIPDDYDLIADLAKLEATEEKTVEALRDYARLLPGRYPSALAVSTAIAEAELDARHDNYDEAAGRDLEVLFTIRNACEFFRQLESEDRDAAYHGDTVGARDFDRVLLRWRLDDGRYRVIWGDLRSETVGAEDLARLETSD